MTIHTKAPQRTDMEVSKIEEKQGELREMLLNPPCSSMVSDDWLSQALTEAHQAGIDEAVEVLKKLKKKNQNYIDGLAPGEMNYEKPRFIESKGIIQALDDTIRALTDRS